VLVGVYAASAAAQSLADVARKEEERRKAIGEPAKVITNKDLTPTPAPPPGTPATASTPKPAGASADKDAKDKDGKDAPKDEAYWKGRQKQLQDQLERDTTFADALQSKINALTTDFAARDDPAQRAQIERDRQKAINDQNRLKKAVEDDKKAIADFQEEARRAGVPPGWLR
jgi:hypothetical protein